jgi:hypothetical protein
MPTPYDWDGMTFEEGKEIRRKQNERDARRLDVILWLAIILAFVVLLAAYLDGAGW